MHWYNRVQTDFFVDETNRVVVCHITAVDDVAIRLRKYGFKGVEHEVVTYKGIAKCHPNDEWDETYGRRLAEYRATQARTNAVNQEIKKFIKTMDRQLGLLEIYGFMKNPRVPKAPIDEKTGE